jgi:hypothetical protein
MLETVEVEMGGLTHPIMKYVQDIYGMSKDIRL